MRVVVMGASNKPERYSYKAVMLLKENRHEVFPVHPILKEIEGIKVYPSIKDVKGPVDTVSIYLSKDISSKLADEIVQKAPRRIIFNPGAENQEFEIKAAAQDIKTLEACTLVLLRTNQF